MTPPRLAEWLLRHLLPFDRHNDAIRGDLLEEFRRRSSVVGPPASAQALRRGRRAADSWYWREALSLILRTHRYKKMLTLDQLRQDLRSALRSCAKAPGFTAIVVVTLSLGIGASTAIFSAVNGILLRPLPFPEPERLLWINEVSPHGQAMSVSWPNSVDWRAREHSFATLAISRTNSFTWTGTNEAKRIDGRRVSGNFFTALGVQPAIGRSFNDGDDRPGAELVAILSHEFWQRQLGGDSRALGRALTLDARPFTVVGTRAISRSGVSSPACRVTKPSGNCRGSRPTSRGRIPMW